MALTSLRRQLEPPDVPAGVVLRANRFTVQLNPVAVVTDVARFEVACAGGLRSVGEKRRTSADDDRRERLLEAVGLYQGELLPGLAFPLPPSRLRNP